jgi:MerR family glutamine synthetase transcriptional repressor
MRVVQELTGLSGRQIRYYDEMGLVKPKRTLGKQRLYSGSDMERLKQVKEMLDKGMTLSSVRTYLRQQEQAAVARAGKSTEMSTIAARNESRTGGSMVRGLKSVYPVSNQAELYEVVDRPAASPTRPPAAPAGTGSFPKPREEKRGP